MTALIGRDAEFSALKQHLADAMSGKGSTVLISGEPGIGKTRLVEEFRKHAEETGARILSGAAMSGSAQPFQVFSRALEGVTDKPLFEEQEYTSFTEIFAVNDAGMLLAKASSEEGGLDADIFAGMLSAVQDFVRDSFGGGKTGLGRLEYGDMKILIEHEKHLFLTAVFSGTEHPDMKNTVKQALKKIEESHGQLIEGWTGKMSDIIPVQDEITRLAGAKFLVRRDLEGIKLENERLRIADRALEALVRLSGDKVLLLLLEDFHWADESSLFVLQYLARNISKSQILLLGTSRPGESDALQKAIESMKGEEILDEINLVKLDVDCTKSLINLTFAPNDFPDTLAERLYEQSKGNPLFVTEMLKGMFQDGSIAEKDGTFTLISESYTVPATVEEVVNRRLDALDPDSMAMVEYASCIGQKFDASLAASNRMIKDADASLEKLLATGVLLRKSGSLEFSHAVFQSVIYNGIGERWKAGHHKSIGEFLEHRFSGNTDDGVYELARHFSKTKEFRKTSEYCIRAGEKAEGSYAMEHALEFYQIALGALSKLDSSQTKGEFLNIMEREGDIEVLMADYDKALLNYQNALNLTENGNSKAKLMRKIAGIYEKRGEFDKSLDILSEARALIEETRSAEYARNLLGQGFTNWKKGDYDKAMSNLKDAIKIFAETGSEQRDTGNALRAIGNIHWGKGDFGSAREYYERSLAVMEKANDLYGIAAAFANIGIAYDGLGEWDKALYFYNRGLDNYEKVGDKSGIAITLGNIGLTCQNKGDLKSSIEFYRRSLDIKERIGDKQGIAMSLNNIGNIHITTGDLDKALDFHKRSLVIHEKIGDKRGVAMSLNNVGVVHNLMGETDEALKSHLRSLEVCSDIGQKNLVIYNQVSLSELFLRLGELHTALTHAEKAVSIALEINARPELGQSIQALGMVRREIGEWDEAKKEFEEAKEILEEVGRKEDLAKFRYEYGLLFKAMEDSSKAREIMSVALADCEDLGMRLWAERCRKVLSEL